jgi:hypothetical protein
MTRPAVGVDRPNRGPTPGRSKPIRETSVEAPRLARTEAHCRFHPSITYREIE